MGWSTEEERWSKTETLTAFIKNEYTVKRSDKTIDNRYRYKHNEKVSRCAVVVNEDVVLTENGGSNISNKIIWRNASRTSQRMKAKIDGCKLQYILNLYNHVRTFFFRLSHTDKSNNLWFQLSLVLSSNMVWNDHSIRPTPA